MEAERKLEIRRDKFSFEVRLLGLSVPTVSVLVNALVHKGWITKQRALHDDRAMCFWLSRQGQVLVRKIKNQGGENSSRNHFCSLGV